MPEVRPLSAEGAVDVTSLYIDLLGGEAQGDRPHVALNMVVSADGRATLVEIADGITVDEVLAATEADLIVPEQVPSMAVRTDR